MSIKKDSAVALVIGSSSIVEPGSMANVAPDIAPSIEVEPHADLHMREVSQSPPHPPPRSLPILPSLPSHLESQGDSSESS